MEKLHGEENNSIQKYSLEYSKVTVKLEDYKVKIQHRLNEEDDKKGNDEDKK